MDNPGHQRGPRRGQYVLGADHIDAVKLGRVPPVFGFGGAVVHHFTTDHAGLQRCRIFQIARHRLGPRLPHHRLCGRRTSERPHRKAALAQYPDEAPAEKPRTAGHKGALILCAHRRPPWLLD